jgi:hypothetical protein
MQLKIRKGPVFPHRLPTQEFDKRVLSRLDECGFRNHIQAQYEAATARVAQDQTEPPFHIYSTAPKLSRHTPAWEKAFTMALLYLTEFKMNATIDTLNIEASGTPFPKDDTMILNLNAQAFLSDLLSLNFALNSQITRFEQAVLDFSEIPISPSCTRLCWSHKPKPFVFKLLQIGPDMIDTDVLTTDSEIDF